MDGSLLSDAYMGLSPAEALQVVEDFVEQCRRFGGQFTLLWHNDSLLNTGERQLYEQILDIVA